MSRPPVAQRIESALQLQPMTVDQLARCLTLEPHVVRRSVGQLRNARRLRAIHVKPLVTLKPWVFYSLASTPANPFCHAQKATGSRYARADGAGLPTYPLRHGIATSERAEALAGISEGGSA